MVKIDKGLRRTQLALDFFASDLLPRGRSSKLRQSEKAQWFMTESGRLRSGESDSEALRVIDALFVSHQLAMV